MPAAPGCHLLVGMATQSDGRTTMAEGTEKHLEHAEHARHAAHDPFDRRVAMTMAIVAAVLACVTMLSHRSHNETLRLQSDSLGIKNEAIHFQSQSNIFHT